MPKAPLPLQPCVRRCCHPGRTGVLPALVMMPLFVSGIHSKTCGRFVPTGVQMLGEVLGAFP
eukprot:9855977-Lingulodinium_polyedra.AAC.1